MRYGLVPNAAACHGLTVSVAIAGRVADPVARRTASFPNVLVCRGGVNYDFGRDNPDFSSSS